MTKKKSKNTLQVNSPKDVSQEKAMAELVVDGFANNGLLIKQFCNLDELDITACVSSVKDKTKKISNGSTEDLEMLLASQAIALDTMFTSLALRSKNNMGEYMHAAEKYMRLALKAQSQCRATIETLADIKNPQPFIQNNKAQYQQVNNKVEQDTRQLRAHAHARENKITNELLDSAHG